MARHSLFTDAERAQLDGFEPRCTRSRRRYVLLVLAVALILEALVILLILDVVSQADAAATFNVEASEILSDIPEVQWLRGTQAIVHNRLKFGVWYGLLILMAAFYSVLAGMNLPGKTLGLHWRTAKYLRAAANDPALDADKLRDIVGAHRPSKRGKGFRFSSAVPKASATPPLSPAKRHALYRAARLDACMFRFTPIFSYVFLVLIVILQLSASVYFPCRARLPWYQGFYLAFGGYDPASAYSLSQIICADRALAAVFSLVLFIPLLVLVPAGARLNARFIPRLVAEMHHLDVRLWRRLKSLSAPSAKETR